MRLNADGINGPWLANYPIPYATTPLTTPTASRTAQFNVGGITYTVVMSGGVGTGPPATEVPEALAATIADTVPIQSGDITPATANDFMYVQILDTNNNVLQTLQTISNDDTRDVWQSASFSLDAYKGQTIRVRFRATNNASNPTGFYVDDVTLDTFNAHSLPIYLPIILKNN